MLSQEERWLLKEKYGGEKSFGFFADCKRLAAGEPLGYVIGWVPFLGCTIYLDNHPLIPRPETEYWVEKAINHICRHTGKTCAQDCPSANKDILVAAQDCPSGNKDILDRHDRNAQESPGRDRSTSQHRTFPGTDFRTFPGTDILGTDRSFLGRDSLGKDKTGNDATRIRVLDLCAGSGCIGVAVARHVPGARVDFGEVDPCLLSTIEKNLAENTTKTASEDLSVNRKVWLSDLFESITETYDFILSNPPYIDPALDRADASVREHEPHGALYGGQGGLELITRIIAGASAHLTPGGELWLEHEPEQTTAISELARTSGLSCNTHQDQYKTERYSILVLQ